MQESEKAIPEPNFFQCPNIIIDKYLKELSGSELKCFLFIVRKTKGWHKDVDAISISQFEEYTGLSNRAVIDACNSLVSRGFIFQDVGQRGVKLFTLDCKKFTREKSSHVKKVHGNHEKSSQVTSEKSSHTKESSLKTLSKDTNINTLSAKREKTTLNADDLILLGVDKQIANDWLSVRKAKRAPLTKTALDAMQREADKANITLAESVAVCAENGWQGFKCDWYQKLNNKPNNQNAKPTNKHNGFSQRDYSVGINDDGSF
jgi:phage replication O-like protein O